MSRLLRLLDGDRRTQIALMDLQRMVRDDSDIRLLADITHRTHMIMRILGLDTNTATARETYQALKASISAGRELLIDDWLLAEVDGQIISFNREDVVENYHHELPLEKQRIESAKRGLGFEIMRRYKKHPKTNEQAVERVVCAGGICWIERD